MLYSRLAEYKNSRYNGRDCFMMRAPPDRRALRDVQPRHGPQSAYPHGRRAATKTRRLGRRSAIDASVGPGDVEVAPSAIGGGDHHAAAAATAGPRRRGVLRALSPPFSGPASPDNLVNEPDRLKGEFVLPQWKKWDKWCFGEGSPSSLRCEKKNQQQKKNSGANSEKTSTFPTFSTCSCRSSIPPVRSLFPIINSS